MRTFTEVYEANPALDKTTWGPGEWDQEPDKAVWIDEATGLDCMLAPYRVGGLCGYVGVTQAHPWFGKGYDSVPVDVHGGLTFADACQEGEDPASGVCHLSDEPVWWFGFDCVHMMDLAPYEAEGSYIAENIGGPPEDEPGWMRRTYKNVEFVCSEVEALAAQVAKA